MCSSRGESSVVSQPRRARPLWRHDDHLLVSCVCRTVRSLVTDRGPRRDGLVPRCLSELHPLARPSSDDAAARDDSDDDCEAARSDSDIVQTAPPRRGQRQCCRTRRQRRLSLPHRVTMVVSIGASGTGGIWVGQLSKDWTRAHSVRPGRNSIIFPGTDHAKAPHTVFTWFAH